MAYPDLYDVTYSYTGFQQAQGDNSFPGTQLDADLAGLQRSIENVAEFAEGAIRSDGALKNGIVTYDSLSPALQTAGLAPADAWATDTLYTKNTNVIMNGALYRAAVEHTSGVFADDLAAGKWTFVAALPASTGDVVGPNVATDGELAVFDTDTGKKIKRGGLLSAALYTITGFVGAVGRTIADYFSDDPTVKDFGAKGDAALDGGTGTNDTLAFQNAISACVANDKRTLRVPPGIYRITESLTLPTAFRFRGASFSRSILKFEPTADSACVIVTAGPAQAINCTISDLSFYSPDTTHQKTALDLYDLSACVVERINIFGANAGLANFWSGGGGAGSIGIRISGREATTLRDLKIAADSPIFVSQNPNEVPTNCEELDHWHFSNFYLIANGHPCITVSDGLGVSNLTIDGYQAWVGAAGGFYLNDTRVAPVVKTRNISISNVRTEQFTLSTSYVINISAAAAIDVVTVKNSLFSSGSQGIRIVNSQAVILEGVTTGTAAGRDSLNISGAAAHSIVKMDGCQWQLGSNFILTGYTATLITHYNAANSAGPSTAVYTNILTNTAVNVAKVTANSAPTTPAMLVQATGGGDGFQLIPNAAGNGGSIRATNNAQTDFAPFTFTFSSLDFRYRTGVGTSAVAWSVLVGTGESSFNKRLKLPASVAGMASLNVATGVDPTAPADGDVWFDGTALKIRIAGVTKTVTVS